MEKVIVCVITNLINYRKGQDKMMNKGYMGYVAFNIVIVSVDEYCGEEMKGRLYHVRESEGEEFYSVLQMLKKMEALYNQMRLPMSSTEDRYFVKVEEKEEEEPLQKQEVMNMDVKPGKKATFVIHVCYRQNATWQGTILWADEKKKVSFRSTLELLKLMDNALNEAETVKEVQKEGT